MRYKNATKNELVSEFWRAIKGVRLYIFICVKFLLS